MEFFAPDDVRSACAEGLRLGPRSGVAVDTARRIADGRSVSVSALRRLVRWHQEHGAELGAELLLRGGRGGDAWARAELQRWADAVQTGAPARSALEGFGATMRAAGGLVGDDGGDLAAAGRAAGRASRGWGPLAALLGLGARPRVERAPVAPVAPSAPVAPVGRPVEAWADGKPVAAWVVEGVAHHAKRR